MILVCAGCASHPRVSKRSLSDFRGDQAVYATYLEEYRAGYEAALRTESRDVNYLPGTKFTPADEAKIKGWQDGQHDGWFAALKSFQTK